MLLWADTTYIGSGASTHHNEFVVTNNAKLWMKGDFSVGYNGSDNRLVIDDRSVADLRSVFTIGSSASATNNSVYIGTNCVVRNPSHTVIGYDGSVSSRLEVVHAAFTNSTFDVGVGRHAHAGLLRIADGAQFYADRRFAVGAPKSFDYPDEIVSAPRDNTVIVEGAGSLLHVPCVTVGSSVSIGWYGTNNAMIVRDGGSFKMGGSLSIGPKANAVSNRLVVAGKDSRLTVGSASYLGSLGSNNEIRFEDGAQVQLNKLHVGNGNGACSNTVFIGSGAVVSNSFAVIVGTSSITDPSSAVGNGVIVSNAVMRNSLDADETLINLRGKGGYLKVIDGGVFTVHQSICVGGDYNSGNAFSDCSDGLIEVRGKGSYMEATRYHFGIGRCGHDNGVVIADGGACVLHDNMRIGCDGRAGATNNYLHISNGSFSNNSSQRLYLYNNSRLIWEGSQSTAKISTIEAHEAAQFDFIFDKDGIAAFGPTYETYMIDAAHKPTVSKFRIDATKYVKNVNNPHKKTFTILKSNDNRQCRVIGTWGDLPAADFEAINAAFRDLIVCEPAENVKVTKVDLQHSRIEVEVTVPHGMAIIVR